jgi:hypothetical protein
MADHPHNDLLTEDTIRLEEAARIARSHFTSVYRWVLRGLPGPDGQRVRLEAVRVGRAWITSREALARFAERLTPPLGEDDLPPTPRSRSARRRASERAAAALAARGI